ncbi:MAG: hypothetical protein IKJ28_07230, partial [Alphaproteobacteria bacterium]|nr:hypothetical protein [Alphaproteobacteria bacterium]
VCDESRDYYQGPSGCLQCEAMTEKWCHRVVDGDENETRDWVGHDIQCSAMDGTSWWCNAYTFETDENGASRWSIYNPSSGTYCGPWKVLKKSGNKFVCGTCDNLPLHRRSLQREGRTDDFGYCTCRGYYTYDKSTGECVRNACRASNQYYYPFIDKCLPCINNAVYVNGICYNDAKYENCSLCYNGKSANTDGSRNYFWHVWWKNTPDYCHTNGNYEPSLKKKSEDRCSYEYGCMDKNIQKPYCDFNTKIIETCQCSTGGSLGQYCCSATTYPTSTGCASCSTGQVPNSSRTGCEACPRNTITKDGKCAKCDIGYYPSTLQNRCLPCPEGRTTDEDGLTCSVCIDSNKTFNMITNKCECPPEISFEDPINGNCIVFEDENTENMEE